MLAAQQIMVTTHHLEAQQIMVTTHRLEGLLIMVTIRLVAQLIMVNSSSGGSTDNGDNGDDSSSGGSTENNVASGSESTENNTAPPSGFRESNDTGNATQESNNTGGNNTGTAQADFYNGILEVHNSERAAVGVPPLVWSDTLAAHAQDWVDRIVATGKYQHCFETPGWEQIESCTHHEGENLQMTQDPCPPACKGPYPFPSAKDLLAGWTNEKNSYRGGPYNDTQFASQGTYGHYTAMVWRTTTEVGCAMNSTQTAQEYTRYLSCRYSPPGNFPGQTPY